MPASRQSGRGNGLPQIVPKRVDNTLSLEKYYRSANLLVRQAAEYRAQHNDLQLYTMLMRLASLIVETIPTHRDFKKSAPTYVILRKIYCRILFLDLLSYIRLYASCLTSEDLAGKHIPELERLKFDLQLQRGGDQESWLEAPQTRVSKDAVQISSSNLPQLDWGQLPSNSNGYGNAGSFNADLLDSFASMGPNTNSQSVVARPTSSNGINSDFSLPTFSAGIRPVSQATRDRHALMPSMAPNPIKRQSSSGTSSYPIFDSSPLKPIEYQMSQNGQSQGNFQTPPTNLDLPSAPPLNVDGQNGQRTQSLMDLEVHPRPSPLLGPQEFEVQSMAPLNGPPDPNGTCNHEAPPPPPQEQIGEVKKIKGLREVHVAMKLMEEFLHFVGTNTKRDVESCGVLAGQLDSKEGIFKISTLIIPKQKGTSNTVEMLEEVEVYNLQDQRGLYPMGWIHTHPSQTCFLSSIDVHTQCAYQTMLEEAVAIVMAPTDRRQKCGIFRLDTPAGLKMVQKCPLQGFHPHDMPNNTPVYDLCGHVFLNERIKHDVVDLR